MHKKLPVSRLNRLIWIQAVIIGFIFYLVATNGHQSDHVAQNTALTMVGILLVGYLDIFVLKTLSKRLPIRTRKFSVYRRVLTYLGSAIIYLMLRPLFFYIAAMPSHFWDLGTLFVFVGSGFVINTLINLLHDSVLLYEQKLQGELELAHLQASNIEAKNHILMQQIQPHFLFNALNTLKALYHKDPNRADDYIVHMAAFLRTSISQNSINIVSIQEELNVLKNYLAMQKIRFGAAINCKIDLPQEILENHYLPSISFQPLLENSINHNYFTQESPLNFDIRFEEPCLIITYNLQKKKYGVASTNNGLANLTERYRLITGEAPVMKEDGGNFSCRIKVLKNRTRAN